MTINAGPTATARAKVERQEPFTDGSTSCSTTSGRAEASHGGEFYHESACCLTFVHTRCGARSTPPRWPRTSPTFHRSGAPLVAFQRAPLRRPQALEQEARRSEQYGEQFMPGAACSTSPPLIADDSEWSQSWPAAVRRLPARRCRAPRPRGRDERVPAVPGSPDRPRPSARRSHHAGRRPIQQQPARAGQAPRRYHQRRTSSASTSPPACPLVYESTTGCGFTVPGGRYPTLEAAAACRGRRRCPGLRISCARRSRTQRGVTRDRASPATGERGSRRRVEIR